MHRRTRATFAKLPTAAPLGPSGANAVVRCCKNTVRRAATAIALVSLGFALAPLVTTVPSALASTTWNAQSIPTGVGELAGLACPSTSDCFAVGEDSSDTLAVLLATTDAGTTWTTQSIPSGLAFLLGIACPSTSDCYAVGDTPSYTSAEILATKNAGATWTIQSTQPGSLLGIACPSISDCYAVGSGPSSGTNSLIVATTNGGATWTVPNFPPGLGGLNHVACPSTSDCYAVGYGLATTENVIMTTTDAGANWTQASAPNSVLFLAGIACPSTTVCYASGLGGLLATTDGGVTWNAQPVGNFMASVACLSTSECYAVGFTSAGTINGLVFATTDSGMTWTAQSIPSDVQYLYGVACPAEGNCYAVGLGTGSLGLILSNGPTSACAAGFNAHVLTATYQGQTFTGLFCVNAKGIGTYTQGTVTGWGSVTASNGTTTIIAFGNNLALLGITNATRSGFIEFAPAPIKLGTFTLT
jgi:photosystem II stability/assembly factor-like uncharacterized protein